MGKHTPTGETRGKIYAYMRGYTEANGYPPTMGEVSREFDIRWSIISEHFARLVADGKLRKVDRGTRKYWPAEVMNNESI